MMPYAAEAGNPSQIAPATSSLPAQLENAPQSTTRGQQRGDRLWAIFIFLLSVLSALARNLFYQSPPRKHPSRRNQLSAPPRRLKTRAAQTVRIFLLCDLLLCVPCALA